MSHSGLKDPASMNEATSLAHRCRTAPANSLRSAPASGPKAEPVRLNGVPTIREKGVSK